jgi:hypothetical protein
MTATRSELVPLTPIRDLLSHTSVKPILRLFALPVKTGGDESIYIERSGLDGA